MKVLEPPLDAISRVARPYPAYLLPPNGTGLCLFAAAFLGHNDAIHMARAEMTATCVDVDEQRLGEMAGLYPSDWTWRAEDAWDVAEENRINGIAYHVVSVDTFTGDTERRSLNSLNLWCSIATDAVTVTHSNGSEHETPDGWHSVLFPRSDDVNWLVLTRC